MAKVAIVGCGAMGSVYAALMADAGHQIHAVTHWTDHVAAIEAKGLRVEGASGDRTVKIRASTSTDNIGLCDLVIIATKAFDVAAAARTCAPLTGETTVIQTIQNGLGSADVAASIVGADRLAVGVVGGFGASLPAPGHVHHNGMEMIRFGAFAGLPRDALDSSTRVWTSAGFKVAIFDDVQRMIWEKLIMNVAFSGSTATTGLTIGEVLADPNAWSVALGCAKEAIAVAEASGICLDVGDPIEHIRSLGGKIPNARPSMLIDHAAGHRGEVDVINGAISRLGRKVGVPTPVNDSLVAIIKAREAKFI
jgi:2-dehydropantoate 2-reductase